MANDKKFGMLRKMLRTMGLSEQSSNDAVDFIIDLLSGEKQQNNVDRDLYPYHLQDTFLSPAELRFFRVLESIVDDSAFLCIKVGLKDIFKVKTKDRSQWRIAMNKIDRKHVDFILCDNKTMQPIVGIELDDKSHERKDRKARDAFVDNVFAAAGLPILHIPVRRDYDEAALKTELSSYLTFKISPQKPAIPVNTTPSDEKPPAKKESASASPTSKKSPDCPRCGSEMILRTGRKGKNAGKQFWGCSTYPECRAMVAYEPDLIASDK
ncbi:MAG: DUF2726 domain-containing protein [Aggregatilineales bacterium]